MALTLFLIGEAIILGVLFHATKKLPKPEPPTRTVRLAFVAALLFTLFAGFPVYFLSIEPKLGLDPVWRPAYPVAVVLAFGVLAAFLKRLGVELYEPARKSNV